MTSKQFYPQIHGKKLHSHVGLLRILTLNKIFTYFKRISISFYDQVSSYMNTQYRYTTSSFFVLFRNLLIQLNKLLRY